MKFKSKTYQKIVSGFFVILILVPNILILVPSKANAQEEAVTVPVSDIGKPAVVTAKVSFISKILNGITATESTISSGTDIKQWALKILEETLRNLAKRFLQKMTESTVNWINSGFHGSPLFLERPGSFFKDIAKYEIRNLVGSIGYDNGRFPFGKSFLINAIRGYKSTFEQNAQYSLSKVTNDPALLESFREDFSTGGWDGFFVNTQFQQNNFIGSQLMYSDQLSKVLEGTSQTATQEIQEAIAQGQGFLSPQKCETNPNFNKFKNQFQQPIFRCPLPAPVPEDCTSLPFTNYEAVQACMDRNTAATNQYNTSCGQRRAEWAVTNDCPARENGTSGFVRTTPGAVVADQIMNSLTSGKRQGELAIAMGNSLSAIFDALLNQLMSKGLNALTSRSNTPPSDSDDFNYYGNTLGPNTSTGAGNTFDWSQIRDNPVDIDALEYDESVLIDWTDPSTDPNVLNQFNNDINPSSTCPAGQTGTPPNCVPNTCPVGQTGTPPNCVEDDVSTSN